SMNIARIVISSVSICSSRTPRDSNLKCLKGASRMLGRNLHLVYLEINFARLYEGMPRFDALLGLLFDRGFELVALYRVHYLKERAGWTDGLFINTRSLLE